MKRFYLLAAIMGILSLAVWGCGSKEAAKDEHAGHDHSAHEMKKGGTIAVYPLNCGIVDGEKLATMGDIVTYTHKGRKLKFCCKRCLASFKKTPEKYLSKIDDAVKAGKLKK